jgi:hypothetical protein
VFGLFCKGYNIVGFPSNSNGGPVCFLLRHGHPDNRTLSDVSRILGFPNVRLDINDVLYNLTKCPNSSRVLFHNKNFDQMFDKKKKKN